MGSCGLAPAHGSLRRPVLTMLGALTAASAAAAVWGIGIERHLYTVRLAQAEILPPGSRPLRVLHLSDIHMAPWQRRKQAWLAGLAELRPDLVVDTGDNLGHERGLEGIRKALLPFAGVPGVFVHGSNDVYAPTPRNPFRYFLGASGRPVDPRRLDTEAMDQFFLHELGWADLNNHAIDLDLPGSRLRLFGVDDPHREWDRLDLVREEQDALGAPAGDTAVLGVAHAPYRRILDAFTDLGADALLAGHTHGGQVCVPGVGALVANCDIPLRQAKGLSTWTHGDRRVPLNVSAGCGTSVYAPVRFACRPEATLLTLLPRDAGWA